MALLICRNVMRSAVEHAACSAIGQETRASPVLEKKLNGQGLNGDRAHRAAETDALF